MGLNFDNNFNHFILISNNNREFRKYSLFIQILINKCGILYRFIYIIEYIYLLSGPWRVLAFLATAFQLSLFNAICVQLRTLIYLGSCHLSLGLHLQRLSYWVQRISSQYVHWTFSRQIRWCFIYLTMSCSISGLNSLFYLMRQPWISWSYIGPYILSSILCSNILRDSSSCFISVQDSHS